MILGHDIQMSVCIVIHWRIQLSYFWWVYKHISRK